MSRKYCVGVHSCVASMCCAAPITNLQNDSTAVQLGTGFAHMLGVDPFLFEDNGVIIVSYKVIHPMYESFP